LLLFSCTNDDDLKEEFVGKTFDDLFYETEQTCLDSQFDPNFFINCHQELHFVSSQKVEVMLSDIIQSTTYSVSSTQVIIHTSEDTFEFQSDLVFERLDLNTPRKSDDDTIWRLREGNSI